MSWRRLVVVALGVGAVLAGGHSARSIGADLARPLSVVGSEYVGSDNCRHCHAENYESWHRTFHRTMTQEATATSVLGDFEGARFEYMGTAARMVREPDGGFTMEFSRDGARERWRARVERTVGSRRYQQYLAREGDVYYRLPLAWNVGEGRWMHMNGAFLTPDPEPERPGGPASRADHDRHVTRWNDNCIFCHNVAPNPGLDVRTGAFESSVGELGIACEACHGPASEHVALNHNPLRRFALHLSAREDPSITDPQRLDDARASQVCGRCHGQRITRDIQRVHRVGDRFVPGEDLEHYSRPLQRDSLINGEEGVFAARFWPDGTARLTAYEYQGLLASPCAERGAMTCGSCHAMHAGDPRGQLRPDLPGDDACTACHQELADVDAATAHSHHRADGPGNSCLGCHMPRAVYGLIGAHRSHRVASPQPAALPEASSPDACTLCHVDRTRSWAAEHSAGWWEQAAPREGGAGTEGPAEVPRLLFAGDPVERALAADALGRPEADAAGAELAPRLGLLLDVMERDDYPAVRAIAWRSVRRLLARTRGASAPEVTAFTATDELPTRQRALARIRQELGDVPVRAPDAALAGELRAQQESTRIFIGE